MNFDQAFNRLHKLEGDYVNDPKDSGGATKYGITEAVARAHGYKDDMRDLPLEFAKAIYRTSYWSKVWGDHVAPVYPEVAYELFDSAVNHGAAVPIKWLQRSLNAFNQQGTWWPDLVVDGGMGPSTLHALQTFASRRKAEGGGVLLKALNGLQTAFYIELAEQRQKDEAFVYGWILNRITA